MILRVDGAVGAALDALTGEALELAGRGHWASGSADAAHVTVRALCHWGEPSTPRQLDALVRATEGSVTLAFRGLMVTETAVLATAVADASAERLRQRYTTELGTDGWLEQKVLPGGRQGWYATLVHFASEDVDRDALLRWADDRVVGEAVFDEAHVCAWSFDGRRMVPNVLATVPLR